MLNIFFVIFSLEPEPETPTPKTTPKPETSTPTPETSEPVMAALRRQRPVQLADVEFGGPASEREPEVMSPEAKGKIPKA